MATLMAPLSTAPTSTTAPSALLPVYKRAPIELVRGEGIRLYDAEGREYVDFTSGIAVNALGYADEGLREAMHAAADGLVHVSNLFRTSPGEELAQRLVDLSFADRVFLCNSGVEANEGAFKFARRWARTVGSPAKHEIVGVRGASMGVSPAWPRPIDRHRARPPEDPIAERPRAWGILAEIVAAWSRTDSGEVAWRHGCHFLPNFGH
jgi:4-aminobutyrate aminotransferase-like enzyme